MAEEYVIKYFGILFFEIAGGDGLTERAVFLHGTMSSMKSRPAMKGAGDLE